jgi:CO/xanthine dehydrogenase Mo-binding subunit
MTTLQQIGKRLPAPDAVDKVTGRSVYAPDVVLPGMLHASVLRSPHAHARIKGIDITKAACFPGVRAVVCAKDAPDTMFGLSIRDERFFAKDEVLYVGDEVAAVVAVDEESARKALDLIEVTYDPLPAVFDPTEAVKPDAPLARMDVESNICHRVSRDRGDVDKGFREAVVICERTYSLPPQYQAYLAPHAATAVWKSGRLTIWGPHQSPAQLEKVICEGFDLQRGGFQFIQTVVGGGFGGKSHMRVMPIAALLSKVVGAPVRLALTREEDFEAGFPSVPMVIDLKMGVNSDGLITAKEVHYVADNGAYTASALGVAEVASDYVDVLYSFENVRARGELVYTNKLASSAFRGYGNTQMHFAVESMLDELAEEVGLDPVEIRLRNATQEGDITLHGKVIGSCGLKEAIRLAVQETDFHRPRQQSGNFARGIGIACGTHGSGTTRLLPDGAAALVRVHSDGSVHIDTSEGDIGQGANTVFGQIAAEELGVPYEKVTVHPLDTDVTNFGVGAVSSRVTLLGGNAVRAGSVAARNRLVDAAADEWQCPPEEVHLSNGVLFNARTEESMEIGEAAAAYTEQTGGSRVIGEGLYRPEGVVVPDGTSYGNHSLGYPFAAHVAEVEVDLETGQITVLCMVAVHDAGGVINPMSAEGQIEGALVQGIGYALTEDYIFREGRILNPDFTNYRMPTWMDAPQMKILFTDTLEENGPFGAKSIGEISMVPVAPAIANAVYNAVGVRLTTLPMIPENVFHALARKNSSA